MCFHIGTEFVDALTSRAANKSTLDISSEVSDGTHPSQGQESMTNVEHLPSSVRASISAGRTMKWLLFILWACL